MNEEEIIEILKNVICDEVIGTYCLEIQKEGVNCSENCKDDDCYLIKAVEGIIDLYTKEKEKNKTYVSKDKIKGKIEDYEKMIEGTFKDNTWYGQNRRDTCYEIIRNLKELLEEK